jgi:hypothetical protein
MIFGSRLILVAGPAEVFVSNCRSFGKGWISQLICSLLRFVVILCVMFIFTVLETCRRNLSIKVLRSRRFFLMKSFLLFRVAYIVSLIRENACCWIVCAALKRFFVSISPVEIQGSIDNLLVLCLIST